MENLKHIFVVYVAIGNIEQSLEIEKFMKRAYDTINPIFEKQDGEVIFIPIRGSDSRIECINPKYITEEELVRKNRLLMDELHEHLNAHLKSLLEENKNNKENEG